MTYDVKKADYFRPIVQKAKKIVGRKYILQKNLQIMVKKT